MIHQANVSPDESQSMNSLRVGAIEGKVTLVTGASRGIGLAIARSLAMMGANVALCARDDRKLQSLVSELEREGCKALPVPADVSRASDVSSAVQKTEQALGPIEILVNNAGIGYFAPVQETSEENWDAVIDTNLKSVFLLSKAVAPGMIRLHRGHIINIASLAGKSAFAGGSIYCASKWGLLGLTQCMAEDLRPYGIRVSAICPGSVNTEFSPHIGKDPAKMLQAEDVAHAVEAIVTQEPQSFISEILLRPTQKP
jgi:NAD(P)-dependent dehydrogenase (short-subunit alcohol dehydrogenase family)